MRRFMKKSLRYLMIISMFFLIIGMSIHNVGVEKAKADESSIRTGVTEDGIEYSIKNDEVKIVSYKGDATSVTIPNMIEGCVVTTIAHSAFANRYSLEEINIPDSVTCIGPRAFYLCYNLNNVTLPSKLTDIEEEAFFSCSKFTSVVLPDGLKRIGDQAFYVCYRVPTIEIPESVTSIGYNAFGMISDLKIFCKKFSHAEEYAKNSGIEYVCTDVFVSDNGFQYCIDDGKAIVVGYTENSDSIEIPEIIDGYESKKIYDFDVPDYNSLTSIYIPKSVIDIDLCFFDDCSNLTRIDVSENNSIYSSQDGVMFNKNKTVLLVAPKGIKGEYVIPEGVVEIGKGAFKKCDELTSIKMPESLINIGEEAFGLCSRLSTIEFSKELRSIGEDAFCYCDGLSKIKLPDKLISIEEGAFSGCLGLKIVEVPDSVTSMGNFVFSGSDYCLIYCKKGSYVERYVIENEIDYVSEDILSTENGFRYYVNNNSVIIMSYIGKENSIIIPEEIDGYAVTGIEKNAFADNLNLVSVTISESITRIGEGAFADNFNLASVTIPESVTKIGEGAFANTGITTINIPSGVTTIEKNTFRGSYLTSIELPESVTRIGEGAFYFSKLKSIDIPKGVTKIEEDTFAYSGLREIVIPENVKYIEPQAFANSALERIEFKKGLESIGDRSFALCYNLSIVELPEGVKSIGDCSFYNCTNLLKIIIPESVESIAEYAFVYCYRLTIFCSKGTYAEQYAEQYASENEIEYKCVDILKSASDYKYYIENDCAIITYYYGDSNHVEIPEEIDGYKVTGVDQYTFYKNNNIVSVSFPSSVINIADYAFVECYSIESMSIPKNVINMGEHAIYDFSRKLVIYCEKNTCAENYAKKNYIKWIRLNGKNIADCYVGLEKISMYCSDIGVEVCPKVILRDEEAGRDLILKEDYVVSYSNNTEPGIGTVTIEGIEDYVGKVEMLFEILPKKIGWFGASDTSTDSIELIWQKNLTADGYIIEQYIDDNWVVIKRIESREITNYVVSGLEPETTYEFRVAGYNINNNSGDYYDSTKELIGEYSKREYIETDPIVPAKVIDFSYIDCTDTTITFKWTAAENANAYYIKVIEGDTTRLVAMIKGGDTESYTVTRLEPDTSYEFYIVGCIDISGGYISGPSNSVFVKTLSTPEIETPEIDTPEIETPEIETPEIIIPSAVKSFTNKSRTAITITLKWAKNTSADGYVIEQYKSGKWSKIKTITSNGTVSYKVTGLKASTTYKFRIKAYKKDGSSKLYSTYTSKSIKTLPSAVKSFTNKSRTAITITLKWAKNTSADGYVVQQYKGGKWVTIKTITKNSTVSYKVTGLKASTTYKFRIKAYKKDGSSKLYSTYTSKSIKTIPYNVKSFTYKTRTKTSITLKWKKNTSADGYVIQQYKGGKWVTVKTITKNSTVSYKVTGLKKTTTYKFRIKAYKKTGSSKLYSAAYTTKQVKTLK